MPPLRDRNGGPMFALQRAPTRRNPMKNCAKSMLAVASAVLPLLLLHFGSSQPVAAEAQPEFASHRAVYELKLAHSRGNSSTMSARGRILYDFSGNACDGYAL